MKPIIFSFAALLLLLGCNEESGQLSLSLTDSSTDRYNAVYVTIREVQVHKDGDSENSWKTVASPEKTFNLLDLSNGVREALGIASLEAGHYTQVRLLIGNQPDAEINILSQGHPFANYVIDADDNEYHKLKVPSGEQTGTKIVHEFDVSLNETTELILDFDASRSVVVAGKSGQYLLKPVIKILNTTEYAILNGQVSDSDGNGIDGAMVMAQIFDLTAADKKDEVITESATITNDGVEDAADLGAYALFLEPDTYNLVVYKVGFQPDFEKITLETGETATEDFSLSSTGTGNIEGQVSISGGDDETYVTLSFRQTVLTDALLLNEKVELVSVNVVNGGDYSVALPPGDYEVVSSTFGQETQTTTVTVTEGSSTTHAVTF